MKTIEEKAIEIAKLMQDGKARNTVLIKNLRMGQTGT